MSTNVPPGATVVEMPVPLIEIVSDADAGVTAMDEPDMLESVPAIIAEPVGPAAEFVVEEVELGDIVAVDWLSPQPAAVAAKSRAPMTILYDLMNCLRASM